MNGAPKNEEAPRRELLRSPSRFRFRPPFSLTFGFRLRPSSSASSYSRSVLGARGNLGPPRASHKRSRKEKSRNLLARRSVPPSAWGPRPLNEFLGRSQSDLTPPWFGWTCQTTKGAPMASSVKPRVIAGAVAGLAVAGGGAALAADQLGGSPQQENQAVVNDAAKQLGVTPGALSSALKKALENRVDAAVAAGRLTKAQGDELKQRIESGDMPLFAGPGLRMHHMFGMVGHGLDAAASYLGLSEDQLRTQLENGKTLADV